MSVRLFVRGQPVKLAPYLVYKSPDIAREIQVREYEGWSAGYCFGVYCDADCEYTNEGESEEHRLAKREIRQALLQVPGVTDVRLERYLREVRPDVSFVVNGQLVAIEIQLSQLSPEKIEGRTKSYARRNIAVLWMPLFSPASTAGPNSVSRGMVRESRYSGCLLRRKNATGGTDAD